MLSAADQASSFRFDFSGPGRPGAFKIAPDLKYSKESGYGFDLNTNASKPPFFFSVALPEGNYRVTAHLGDPSGACVTTIKAESRR